MGEKIMRASGRTKMNNRGSAIVTVIVVIAFMAILATTVLYLSSVNYRMKREDLKTKQGFYEAETALEELRGALMVESSRACDAAYKRVASNYASTDPYTRYATFQDVYFQTLEGNWRKKLLNAADPANPYTYEQVLQHLVSNKYASSVHVNASVADAGELDLSHSADGYAILPGVKLVYTDDQGYVTIIETDFLLTVPKFNFGSDASLTTENGDVSKDRTDISMAEYVQYYNWVKK